MPLLIKYISILALSWFIPLLREMKRRNIEEMLNIIPAKIFPSDTQPSKITKLSEKKSGVTNLLKAERSDSKEESEWVII